MIRVVGRINNLDDFDSIEEVMSRAQSIKEYTQQCKKILL